MSQYSQTHFGHAVCDVRTIDLIRASDTPEAIALKFKNREISYRYLAEMVSRLGFVLLKNTVEKSYVAICMINGLEPAITYLACLRYGIKFAIVNPELDCNALRTALALVSPAFILTDSTTYYKSELGAFHKIKVDLEELELSKDNTGPGGAYSEEDSEAVMIFSSGSTGQPKGICHSYQTLNALIDHSCILYPSGIDLFSIPMAGLGGLQMLLTALVLGKPTRILASSSVDQIVDAIHSYLPERVLLFPAIIARLVAEPSSRDDWIHAIKECHSGGDSISSSLIETFKKLSGLDIRHAYGMAEFGAILKSSGFIDGSPTFTKLSTNRIRLTLLTEHNEIAQPGDVGHLHVESSSLMKGYRHMGEKSATLDQIPFPTNDWFRLCADGSYKYIGRGNGLLKFDDEYVSINEIENIIRRESKCQDIVMVSNKHGELVACVQRSVQHSCEQQQLAIKKAAEVAFKINLNIKQVLFVDQLPLGPTGKIDRQKIAQLVD